MALSIQILLAVLVLASFVIAYFSARTWHWGHVLVVLGIFLSTLLFLVLASETLRIYAVYGRDINQKQRNLANQETLNEALRKGDGDADVIGRLQKLDPPVKTLTPEGDLLLSMAELNHRLLVETGRRGRVWRNVLPAGPINPQTGELTIATQKPTPAGFKPDTVVYVFEEGPAQLPAADGRPRGTQYLGSFRITQATGQQAKLLPVLPMDKFEQGRLTASRGPWIVYETMPADRYEIFKDMTEEKLRQKIPPQSVKEYIRHGKEPGPDDPPERVAGIDENLKLLPPDQIGKATKRIYQRRRRDYAAEFAEISRRRVAMEAGIEAAKTDNERLAASLASAKKLQAFREDEIKKLQSDLSGIKSERKTIETHLSQVERQLARGRELLAETLKQNRALVAQLGR